MTKRLADILLAIVGIFISIPFTPLIALLIKLDSRGPVFYRCDRVGKGMKIFKMYKFRTMMGMSVRVGESISPQLDPRVTRFGRFLRLTKINELPQFINILKNDMSFVGPRPEAPDLAELYPEFAKRVFSVKPGLVGPHQVTPKGSNEEDLYPPGVDAKKFYIEEILPAKVKMDLEYIDHHPTLFKDIKYIFGGVKVTLAGILTRKHIREIRPELLLFLADGALSVASYVFAETISDADFIIGRSPERLLMFIPALIIIRGGFFYWVGMYDSLILHISYREIFRVLIGVSIGSILLASLNLISGTINYHGLPAILDWSFLVLLLSCTRFGLKLAAEKSNSKTERESVTRVLIFGAGRMGELAHLALATEKRRPFEVIGFIDDDPRKYGKRLNGLRVIGNRYHVDVLAQLHNVSEMILAVSDALPDQVAEIVRICQKASLTYQIFSPFRELDENFRIGSSIRSLEISDLLPIPKVHMDRSMVKQVVSGKTVLVNGAVGAMGLELCRLILQFGCRKLIVSDRYESYLARLMTNLLNLFPKESIVPLLLTTNGIRPLEEAFAAHRPNLVFHASMKKYVSPFITSDEEIAHINYRRTFNLAKLAVDCGSESFVMISSMAAGNGPNPISHSLRIAELSLLQFFEMTDTRLVIGRICDIVENQGGIVSVMEDQIRRRATLELPSADYRTYLLSKSSAAEFILQTVAEATLKQFRGGIFVCDAGPPISLFQVARKLAALYELDLDKDISVRFTNSSQSMPESYQEQANPVATSHNQIKFLKENGTPYSPQLQAELQHLASFFEGFS
jgi:FlaA1/EpsC-like NDP-sugar epimerase/lipopolysaccharide/colanic/teichoic acid biosynthesis glycosyltransferase